MEENSHFSHKIYKNDPLLFKSYIGMEVNILIEDGTTISGIVYTVDPVSERLGFILFLQLLFHLYTICKLFYSVVLLQNDQQNRLKIVFGHAIKNVKICSDKSIKLPELFTNNPTNILPSIVQERKSAVIRLLKENRFSVKEENDILTIENVLSIKSPYEPADCICANSIILGRIQNLLSRIKI
ncbi:Gem-associated protein 6 [Anthophora retusa]